MIYIDKIPNICTSNYDEVWWIVRSPDSHLNEKLNSSFGPNARVNGGADVFLD